MVGRGGGGGGGGGLGVVVVVVVVDVVVVVVVVVLILFSQESPFKLNTSVMSNPSPPTLSHLKSNSVSKSSKPPSWPAPVSDINALY